MFGSSYRTIVVNLFYIFGAIFNNMVPFYPRSEKFCPRLSSYLRQIDLTAYHSEGLSDGA